MDRGFKVHEDFVAVGLHVARHCGASVADLCGTSVWNVGHVPDCTVCFERERVECSRICCDLDISRADALHKGNLLGHKIAQAVALPDCVLVDSFVGSDLFAIHCKIALDDLAIEHIAERFRKSPSILNDTDILAVGGLCGWQTVLCCQFSDFRFFQVTEWEFDTRGDFVREPREKIALVFSGIEAARDSEAVLMIDDTDIMACGHVVAPEGKGEIEQNPELDEFVASDAWGGRARMGVIIPGWSEDDLWKDVADFADMVFNAQIFGIL